MLFILQEGMQLIAEKPETEAVVKEKLTGLHQMWEELESTTQTKAQRLFDANKAELFTQSCADLDKWLNGLESQIQSDDYGKDLTSVNILLKKQQVNGTQLQGGEEISALKQTVERIFSGYKRIGLLFFLLITSCIFKKNQKYTQKQISHVVLGKISNFYMFCLPL